MAEHNFAKSLGFLLQKAERLLLGPKSLGYEDKEFWGRRYLALRSERIPKINGAIETRTVYANPVDTEQAIIILRRAYWDAELARTKFLQILRNNDEIVDEEPELYVSYTYTSVEWLNIALSRFHELSVPMKLPQAASEFEVLSYFSLERQDGTVLNLSWGKNMAYPFTLLDHAWSKTWEEMEVYLQKPMVLPVSRLAENW